MPDSNPSDADTDPDPDPDPDTDADLDALATKHERNREERLEGIVRWADYVREQPPDVWGPQQNRLVNSQLESARETGLSVEHERRVRAFAAAASEESGDEPESVDES
jgi:hypothetical protein